MRAVERPIPLFLTWKMFVQPVRYDIALYWTLSLIIQNNKQSPLTLDSAFSAAMNLAISSQSCIPTPHVHIVLPPRHGNGEVASCLDLFLREEHLVVVLCSGCGPIENQFGLRIHDEFGAYHEAPFTTLKLGVFSLICDSSRSLPGKELFSPRNLLSGTQFELISPSIAKP